MAVSQATLTTSGNRSHTMNVIDWLAMTLMIVGGLNWGLIGLANFNLVGRVFGDMSNPARLVYILVGLASVYGIYMVIRWSARQVIR